MTTVETMPARVQVYRNIHRSRAAGVPVYSVRDADTGLVVGHTDRIVLADAEFKVSEAGRQRVLRTKAKNVHAWIQGRPVETTDPAGGWAAVTYNPYKHETFVVAATGIPVHRAALVDLGPVVTAHHPM